jgi:hypothetical protein
MSQTQLACLLAANKRVAAAAPTLASVSVRGPLADWILCSACKRLDSGAKGMSRDLRQLQATESSSQ